MNPPNPVTTPRTALPAPAAPVLLRFRAPAVADTRFPRRHFLQTVAGFAVTASSLMRTSASDLPRNQNPRAIFGDTVEPEWDQHVTLTVGPDKADLVGATDRVIQAAVDYVARRGGGTVRVLPGT